MIINRFMCKSIYNYGVRGRPLFHVRVEGWGGGFEKHHEISQG